MTTPVDLEQLGRRFLSAQMRFSSLQGQAHELGTQKSKLSRDISLAKARIELAPQVTEVFNYLQEKAHAKAVGEFEALLTAFVDDVVPEAGSIRLELGTERGAPALDIRLDNNGDLEDILDGNGGGLTNVVVTGLTYAARSRTSTRPVVVLDEPDCWLKASRVPAFTNVIAEVANPRVLPDGTLYHGCQTLMISHNDLSLMSEGAHIHAVQLDMEIESFADRIGAEVRYVGAPTERAYVVFVPGRGKSRDVVEVRYRDDSAPLSPDSEEDALRAGYPYVESLEGGRAWASTDDVGVRWVEAENLRRHVKTRIELSSGLNVLSGDINGGKSTLFITAFRAMAYGESDDTMIRHGADEFVVRLGLENEVVLEMVRQRKGSPKVLFRRYDSAAEFKAGKPTHQGPQEKKGSAPKFITEVLRINRVDDLDIQLRSQKMPVFLLNESASRRAQLLSVGKESGLLQELIEKHRQSLRTDRDNIKRDEVDLNQVSCKLRALAPLSGISALVDIMQALQVDAENAQATLRATRELVARMGPLQSRVSFLAGHEEGLRTDIAVPAIQDTTALKLLINRLESNQGKALLPMPGALPALPKLHDTTALFDLMRKLKRCTMYSSAVGVVPAVPQVPELKNPLDLKSLVEKLERQAASVKTLEAGATTLVKEEKQADTDLHSLMDSLGVCPVCNKPFEEVH
ncbi:permease [Novimethylophilus kurashikiensis]|uniref:Permease n=1 Tax=Novimethylophilus kurashikiensis TaxID=1825523 RepID=A0A2R5FCL4_9PROT|nr:ATP-binding protein [Novimethylophilus kurashikiensis]GBG14451.1 permease [Novimethylophilus kurashikiensis]